MKRRNVENFGLGSLSSKWEQVRFRYLLTRNDSGVWGEDSDGDGTIVLRSTEQTAKGAWKIKDPAVRSLSPAEKASTRLRAGDLVVTKSSGSADHIGKTSLVDEEIESLECCFSNFMQRLRVREGAHPKFYWYVINAPEGREQLFYRSSTTTGLANLNATILGNLTVPLPPLSTQRAIASFLDRETAKIDTLIEKKERLLELLEEKRTALITQAVTKGLDPDVPMKDSGVEWLGEIPEHWEVVQLRRVLQSVTSGSRGWAQFYADDGALFLRIGNLSQATPGLDLSDIQHVDVDDSAEAVRSRVQPGDLLISITALIGAVGVVPRGLSEAYVNQHVALCRVRENRLNSLWAAYFLLSSPGQAALRIPVYGGTKDGLGLDDIRSLRVVLPPPHEQKEVVRFLDNAFDRFATIQDDVIHAISLLKEYRTALISAAVTGKIDVREEVPV